MYLYLYLLVQYVYDITFDLSLTQLHLVYSRDLSSPHRGFTIHRCYENMSSHWRQSRVTLLIIIVFRFLDADSGCQLSVNQYI